MSGVIRIFCSDEEQALLERYEGVRRNGKVSYEELPAGALAMLCQIKDRSIDLFFRRYQAARDVIDLVAKRVGIDPENTGSWLYTPDGAETADGARSSEIVRRLDEWTSRSGEKARLKRRIQELENENRVLRSLIGGRNGREN